jgi:low temperature requirement protein LtrA
VSDLSGAGGDPVIPDIRVIRARGQEQRATFFELFFDLVYVFAVTQLSHHLLASDLSWTGAAETGFMLIAVYWAWNYTTWMANWFDPDTVPVRLILAYVMLTSLLMAIAIPEGFGDRALLLACSYCALQIGRNAFVVVVTPRGDFNQNFRQILAWSVLSTPLWVVGGLIDDARWVLWLVALGIDLAAPLVRFWVPVAGSTPHSHWQIDGRHFAERFQLFVIIALGESIVLTGVTASSSHLSGANVVALTMAFVSSTALWWLYFDQTAPLVVRFVSRVSREEVGAIGRDVFTYLHLPIVAGIVLTAVGDEIVIAHPGDQLSTAGAIVTLLGPTLYLVGLIACVARIGVRPGWPRVAVAVILICAIPVATVIGALLTVTVIAILLVGLIAVERTRAEPYAATTDPA